MVTVYVVAPLFLHPSARVSASSAPLVLVLMLVLVLVLVLATHSACAMASRKYIGSTESSEVHSSSNAVKLAALASPAKFSSVSPQSVLSAWNVTAQSGEHSRGGAPRVQAVSGSSVPQQTALVSSSLSSSPSQGHSTAVSIHVAIPDR